MAMTKALPDTDMYGNARGAWLDSAGECVATDRQ
jgi:hypothetical protein